MKQIERDARNNALVARAKSTLIANLEAARDTELWRLAEDFAPLWYKDAQDFTFEVADTFDVHPYIVAGIVSAFSIQTRWHKNKEHVLCFFTGDRIDQGFAIRLTKAEELLAYGEYCKWHDIYPDVTVIERILNGQKIRRFFLTILFPDIEDVVVIDTWECKILGITVQELDWKGVYELLEDMIIEVMCDVYGFDTPSTAQAFTWIIARGKVD